MTDAPTSPQAPRVHRVTIQVRWSDTDALGHINNASFVTYAETARIALFDALGAPARAFILAHVSVDFRRQIRYGERVEVESWVEKIGSSSATLRHRILAEGELAGDSRAVVVHFDYALQATSPWTPTLRAALAQWMPA